MQGLLDLGWVFQQLPLGWQLPTGLTEQLRQAGDPGVLGDMLVLLALVWTVAAGAVVVLLNLPLHLLHLQVGDWCSHLKNPMQ